MYRSLAVLSLALAIPFQSSPEQFRQRFERADVERRAGNIAKAEAEYQSILADAYHKLGRTYAAQQNHQAAIAAFSMAIGHKPNFADALVDLAIAQFNTNQFKQALLPLQAAADLNAQSPAVYHMRGKCYFMLSEFDKAAVELQRALQLSPGDYDVSYTLALAYLKQGRPAEANQIFNRMITELGNRPQLRILIGRAYRQTGFLPEATEEFKKAIALDPKFPRVHYYLGLSYLLKDGASRLDDAEAEFKLEVSAHPDDFFANYYLGITSTIGRKWDAAIGFLEKANKLQPDNPDPYFYLGQAYQGLQKHDQAIEMYRKSISLTPDLKHNYFQVSNARYRLGQMLIKVGKTEEGQKELQISADLKAQSFKSDEARADAFLNAAQPPEQTTFADLEPAQGNTTQTPQDLQRQEGLKADALFFSKVVAVAHENLGLLNAERQKFSLAIENFSQAARWDPELRDIYYNLGLAFYKSEKYLEAIGPLENELRLRPDNLRAKQLLGLSYFSTENYQKAAELLAEVAAVRANDASIYYPLALSLSKLGRAEESQRIVQQMLNNSGANPQVHILLAKAFYDQDNPTKALEELSTALQLDPKIKLAHFYSGLVYLKLGKFAEAAREFESEVNLNPSDIQAKYHLGFVLLANQETKRGMQLMSEVIKSNPGFSNAYFELGKTQLQLGDVKTAIFNLEQAAKLAPQQSHVHYQLGRAYLAAGRQSEGRAQLELSKQLKEKERNQPNN